MSVTRRVSLELLRRGPAHNQLLSPLTEYLALCANHHSETLRVPYEHNEFLARHSALMYEDELTGNEKARENRELQLQITAKEMSEVFRGIPGLISELRSVSDTEGFLEFELILSASELAMLPFELATSPNGFPGAGQPLSVQTNSPLCITRRVRRVSNERCRWPRRPKLLFVEALPPADAKELVPAHLLALRKAVAPWIRRDSQGEIPGEDFITFLPQVTVEELQEALQAGQYTHVHILAHGARFQEGIDDRFGLKLYDNHDPSGQIISGPRLAAMITSCATENQNWHRPAVVSIASCNGANGGSVVGAGSSVAHHLHEAGIPLVVSSQFPLSFKGSVVLVEGLYEGLLWGKDPRRLLHCLRRELRSNVEGTHDWASLVTYAAMPDDLDQQLREVKLSQSRASIHAAFSYSDSQAEKWRRWHEQYEAAIPLKPDRAETKAILKSLADFDVSTDPEAFDSVQQKLAVGKGRLKEIVEDLESASDSMPKEARMVRQAEVHGLLASTEKREAELRWIQMLLQQFSSEPNEEQPNGREFKEDPLSQYWQSALVSSKRHYRKAFDLNRTNSWAIVQWIVLSVVEKFAHRQRTTSSDQDTDSNNKILWDAWESGLREIETEWNLANALLRVESRASDPEIRCLAASNRIDMQLLGILYDCMRYKCEDNEDGNQPDKEAVARMVATRQEKIDRLTKELNELTAEEGWEIVSRRRQLNRYLTWFFFYDYEFTKFESDERVTRYENFPVDLICVIKMMARQALNSLRDHKPSS